MCSVFELIDCLIAGYCCVVLVCELAVHTCYRLRSTLLSSKTHIKINASDVLCADWVMKLEGMRRLCDLKKSTQLSHRMRIGMTETINTRL